MRGAAFLITAVIGALVFIIFLTWITHRPEIRRSQLRRARDDAAEYKEMVIDYEETIRNVRAEIQDKVALDRPLALLIDLELQRHYPRLDNPLTPVPPTQKRK